MSAAISISNVTKVFKRRPAGAPRSLKEAVLKGFTRDGHQVHTALRDINLEIEKGKMVGIIGANGAGKSTLLRLIGGVGKPTSGSISVAGSIGALLDLTAGFHPDLTGRENVFITGVICGMTRRETAERFDDIVAFAELAQHIDEPVRTYSSGMQMRLGFAIAIAAQPDILLIDEVLAVGDLAFQQKCLDRINSMKRSGCTILLISHDVSQIQQHCDEAVWLRKGTVVTQGEPERVINEYAAEMRNETRRRTPTSCNAILSSSGIELRPNENRFGSLEMEISSVALRNERGEVVSALDSGQPLRVEISYTCKTPIAAPIFSVSVSREDGLVCYDTNTLSAGVPVPTVTGNGTVTLMIERLELTAGKYFVDVGIYEKEFSFGYDYHWHVYPLSIVAPARKGILHSPEKWAIQSGTEIANAANDR